MNRQNLHLSNASEADILSLLEDEEITIEVNGETTAQPEEIVVVSEPAIEKVEPNVIAVLEEIEDTSAVKEAKREAYAEQKSHEPEIADGETVVAPAKTAEKKERTPRPSFSSKSEAIVHKLGEKAPEFFVLEMADAELDADALKAKMGDVLKTIDSMPKKVGEKAQNLFSFLKGDKELSIYAKIALDRLCDKGVVTSKEMYEVMRYWPDGKERYGEGTARSQAQQMMTLLPTLKIANKSGSTLTVNNDSMIVLKYRGA